MRHFISLTALAAAFVLSSCGEKAAEKTGGNATLEGSLTNSSGDTIYFVDVSQRDFKVLDSAITDENGHFVFKPTVSHKGFYNISLAKDPQQFTTVIMDKGDNITIKADAKNLGYSAAFTGSDESMHFMEFNKYFEEYEKRRSPLVSRLDSLQRAFQIQVGMMKDSNEVNKYEKEVIEPLFNATQDKITAMADEGVVWVKAFIDKHPGSFANIAALRLLDPFDNIDYWEKVVVALEAKHKDAPNVVILRQLLDQEKPFCKGSTPPDIEMNNPEGKPMKLSALKGKIVLLDFWASWCGPCRNELPNVVANYRKYNSKGFEVFSVSLDKEKQPWVDAIKKDGLAWQWHVSDLMYWNSPVVQQYRIQGIPKTLLLDREGKILDRDLRGPALGKKLDEIFAAAN
ncbi:MAG: TlpA disulfide reductase family protein [Bacteroidia bacterium]